MKLFFLPRKRCGVLLAGSAALILSTLLLANCGDVYRPVANPVPAPGGDPQTLHLAVVVNNNHGGAGGTTQVDVAGDSNIGNFSVGHSPVHATFAGSVVRAAVANMADDSVSVYSPTQAGSAVTTISLPTGAAPMFVQSDGKNIYVADSGSNAVAVVSGTSLVATGSIPVGVRPVALAETPDATRLYAINQGDGTVTTISTATLSVLATVPVGVAPTWAAMKSDGSTLYVANQGSNTVSVIDVASNTVTATLNVGAGPRFLAYDNFLQRLYVANTGANTISIFGAGQNPPALLGTVTVGANPTSLTPLADGTRVYVANAGCQDRLDLTTPCTGNTVTVVDAANFTVRKTITVGTGPVWLDSSPDSIRVIVTNRDSDNISDIRTSDDTVIATLPAGSPTPLFVTVSH